ncbi:MAG: hypothetical protein JSS53_09240 [Proteobacteria bacterium]|nr:hypothetical protein [Pseudomonadota bacterium]
MLKELKEYIGGILKFIFIKGNSALYASAQELLILYNLISFYELMQKDANEAEKIEDNLLLVVSIIASLPLVLSNFCVACQAIENTTRKAISFIPKINTMEESHTPLDYFDDLMRNRVVRIPIGVLGAVSSVVFSGISQIVLELPILDTIIGIAAINWVLTLLTVVVPSLGGRLSSEFFIRSGDLVAPPHSNHIANSLAQYMVSLRARKLREKSEPGFLIDDNVLHEVFRAPEADKEIQSQTENENKIYFQYFKKFVVISQYFDVLGSAFTTFIDVPLYCNPILRLAKEIIDDVSVDGEIDTLSVTGIAVIASMVAFFVSLSSFFINQSLTHVEAGEHYIGLETNKWVNHIKTAIKLMTAPLAIGFKMTATMIAVYSLLERWGLEAELMGLSEDNWMSSPKALLTIVLGVGALVSNTALSTVPVNCMKPSLKEGRSQGDEESRNPEKNKLLSGVMSKTYNTNSPAPAV